MPRSVGHGLHAHGLEHQHRAAAANDGEKGIMLRFLKGDLEAQLVAIKDDSGRSVMHQETWRDAVDGRPGHGQLLFVARSGVENRLFDSSWCPRFARFDKGVKDRSGERALVVSALRVPLDGNYEVILRNKLHGFDYIVLRAARGDRQIIAGSLNGLVMARIDVLLKRYSGAPALFHMFNLFRMTIRCESGKTGAGGDGDGMSLCHSAAGTVIDRCANLARDVLDQSAAAPDVQRLRALADGEDGLVQVKGILDQQLVDSRAIGVG